MSLVPLVGHTQLRARLAAAAHAGTLPSSLLFTGPRGVGKQRLAIWLGQLLLCEAGGDEPCGKCRACHFSAGLQHPDLHWVFPRPRPKDADDVEQVRNDLAEAVAERATAKGLYAAPSGSEGIFVATIRGLVQSAVRSPAMARRKVYIVGDADRMVSQEGSDQAANAFLKLLEEPPQDTTVILTSSEPGALLPTIRSRAVAVRVGALSAEEMTELIANPDFSAAVTLSGSRDELIRMSGGAPGRLLSSEEWEAALAQARALVDAAAGRDRAARLRAAFAQGSSGARGKYSDTLDALTVVLHTRLRSAAERADDAVARASARAIEEVERVKEMAQGNVNPQLTTAALLRDLSGWLR